MKTSTLSERQGLRILLACSREDLPETLEKYSKMVEGETKKYPLNIGYKKLEETKKLFMDILEKRIHHG